MKQRFEASLLWFAAWIIDRNVQRSPVVSRKDNNILFEMRFDLRSIAKRIWNGYKDEQ